MPEESILIDDGCGCVVVVYVYDELTLYLIDEYSKAGYPMPERIKKAWDYVIKALKTRTTDTVRITIAGTGTYDADGNEIPVTEYLIDELAGALKIIDVSMEGQGINESDPLQIDINTTTGLVQFGITVTVGAKIKFVFNK